MTFITPTVINFILEKNLEIFELPPESSNYLVTDNNNKRKLLEKNVKQLH